MTSTVHLALVAIVATATIPVGAEPATSAPVSPDKHQWGLVDTLQKSAAVVEGEVTDVSFSYDSWDGPRTHFTLSQVATHLGAGMGKAVTLSFAGGPTPDGSVFHVSELPDLRVNTRYVIILRRGYWKHSPVLWAFPIVAHSGEEYLTSTTGAALTRADEKTGFEFAGPRLLSFSPSNSGTFAAPLQLELSSSLEPVLRRSVMTKGMLIANLRATKQRHQVSFDPFNPVPNRPTPWNMTSVREVDAAVTQ